MKRDMDIIRSMLLQIEAHPASEKSWITFTIPNAAGEDVEQHLILLKDAGFINGDEVGDIASGRRVAASSLTWRGHDLLDAIRDPEIWRRTKAGAEKAGVHTIDFVWELAKAYGKQQIRERLGIELG